MIDLRMDHVAVAVRDLKPAVRLFKDALGGEYLMGGEVGKSWRWFQLRYPGGGKIELLEPLDDGFLTRFLDKRGEGLHHITFKTNDLAATIAHVRSLGYELVDVDLSNPSWKEAFMRPSTSHGTLIQLAQAAHSDDEVSRRVRPSNLDELLS